MLIYVINDSKIFTYDLEVSGSIFLGNAFSIILSSFFDFSFLSTSFDTSFLQ